MIDVNTNRFHVDGAALLEAMALRGGVYSCARRAGIDPSTLYKWCANKRIPRLEEWAALMAILEVSIPFCVTDGIRRY
jgi:DNA-binding phage protein